MGDRRSWHPLVAAGSLVRLRNGRYVPADAHRRAAPCGPAGRPARLRLAARSVLGVFVAEQASASRAVQQRRQPAPRRDPAARRSLAAHRLRRAALAADLGGGARAVRAAVSLHASRRDTGQRLASRPHRRGRDRRGVRAAPPALSGASRNLLDPRSESGPETIMRLLCGRSDATSMYRCRSAESAESTSSSTGGSSSSATARRTTRDGNRRSGTARATSRLRRSATRRAADRRGHPLPPRADTGLDEGRSSAHPAARSASRTPQDRSRPSASALAVSRQRDDP